MAKVASPAAASSALRRVMATGATTPSPSRRKTTAVETAVETSTRVLAESKSFVVTVKSASEAPLLTMRSAVMGNGQSTTQTVNATEGVPLELSVFAQDLDVDHLNWSATGIPAGMLLDVNANGTQATLRWTPNNLAAQNNSLNSPAGTYRFTLTASDGAAQVSREIEVKVANVNQAPRVLPLPLQLIQEGETLAFTVRAADPDGDATKLSLIYDDSTPEGLLFDETTGTLEWTPSQDIVNNASQTNQAYTLNFRASDGQSTGMQSVQVRVFDVNRPPSIRASNHALVVGQNFSLPVTLGALAQNAAGSNAGSNSGNNNGLIFNDADGSAQTQNLAISFLNLPEGAGYDGKRAVSHPSAAPSSGWHCGWQTHTWYRAAHRLQNCASRGPTRCPCARWRGWDWFVPRRRNVPRWQPHC
jgi:Putative Ig domain